MIAGHQRGFTLLELMIAIGIFAMLGLGTYRMLETVLKTDEVTRQHEKALRELTRAFASIDRDLLQTVPRPVRDAYGEDHDAMLGGQNDGEGGDTLEFTHTGWRNPLGVNRSQLQRVRWRLVGDQLQRVYWSVLDQAVDSPARVQKVLGGVKSLQWRFLDEHGEWQNQWPSSQAGLSVDEQHMRLPMAIELKIEQRTYGELTRLYRLPESEKSHASQEEALPPAEAEPSVEPAAQAAEAASGVSP